MKKIIYILSFFPLMANGQVVVNLSPDSTLYDLHTVTTVTEAPLPYVTWANKHADLAIEDSGLVKSNDLNEGWNTTMAGSNEQVSDGYNLECRPQTNIVGTESDQCMIGIGATNNPTNFNQMVFGLYFDDNGAGTEQLYKNEGGVLTDLGEQWVADDYYRIRYAAPNIYYEKSSNGTDWTTVNTSAGTPAGSYYVIVDLNQHGSDINEIIIRPN